jgi:hypothetical protein
LLYSQGKTKCFNHFFDDEDGKSPNLSANRGYYGFYQSLPRRKSFGYIPTVVGNGEKFFVKNVHMHSKYRQKVCFLPKKKLRVQFVHDSRKLCPGLSWPSAEMLPVFQEDSDNYRSYRRKIYELAHFWPANCTLQLSRTKISYMGEVLPFRLCESLVALLRLRVESLRGTNPDPTRYPSRHGCELCTRLRHYPCPHLIPRCIGHNWPNEQFVR